MTYIFCYIVYKFRFMISSFNMTLKPQFLRIFAADLIRLQYPALNREGNNLPYLFDLN